MSRKKKKIKKTKDEDKTLWTLKKEDKKAIFLMVIFIIAFGSYAHLKEQECVDKKVGTINIKPAYTNGYVYDEISASGGRGPGYFKYRFKVDGKVYNCEEHNYIGGENKWYGKVNSESTKRGDSVLIKYYEYDPEVNMVLKVIKNKKGNSD